MKRLNLTYITLFLVTIVNAQNITSSNDYSVNYHYISNLKELLFSDFNGLDSIIANNETIILYGKNTLLDKKKKVVSVNLNTYYYFENDNYLKRTGSSDKYKRIKSLIEKINKETIQISFSNNRHRFCYLSIYYNGKPYFEIILNGNFINGLSTKDIKIIEEVKQLIDLLDNEMI